MDVVFESRLRNLAYDRLLFSQALSSSSSEM